MPTYTYRCQACEHTLETSQKITDAPLKQCPNCEKDTLQRGPGGGIGLAFTGSGFYRTDYGNQQPPADSPSSTSKSTCCPCGKNKGSCS